MALLPLEITRSWNKKAAHQCWPTRDNLVDWWQELLSAQAELWLSQDLFGLRFPYWRDINFIFLCGRTECEVSDICGGHTVLTVPASVWGRNQGTRWLPESHCYQHHGWFPGLAFPAHAPHPSLWLHRLHRPIDYRVTCDNLDYWTWRCPGSEPVCPTEASPPWAQTLKQRERISAKLWVWGVQLRSLWYCLEKARSLIHKKKKRQPHTQQAAKTRRRETSQYSRHWI